MRTVPWRLLATGVITSLLAACGIQSTGVMDGGQPSGGVNVYYVLDGKLHPAFRTSVPGDTAAAIKFLFIGPDLADRAAGVTSAIPAGTKVHYGPEGDPILLSLSIDPARLSGLALTQITCTISSAWPPERELPRWGVGLYGPVGKYLKVSACPLPPPRASPSTAR